MSASEPGMIRRAFASERTAVRRAVVAGLLVTLSTVGLAGTSAWLIVRAAERPVVLSLTVPMGLVQLFALAKAGGRYAERTQTHRAAIGVMGHVRASVARLLEPLLPSGLGPRSVDVVDLVLADVERVQDLLTTVAGPLFTSIVAGLVTLVVSGVVVPWTALSLLGALIVTGYILPVLAARLGQRAERELDVAHAEMVSLFDDVTQGGDEYVMSGASATLERRLGELEDRVDSAQRSRTWMGGVVSALTTLTAGGAALTAVCLSALAFRDGQVGRALIAVPALLSIAALELVGGVTPTLVGLRGDRAALGRLEDLRSFSPPVVDPDVPGPTMSRTAAPEARAVTRSYGADEVLRRVSLRLAPGDFVVLEGPSGGGKTTLARLLVRFLDPTSGSLDLGTTPYRELRASQVREHVGIVDDDPHVFHTTLASNLRIAKTSASDLELLEACEIAGLAPLLATLPEGLETVLGGASTGLSGGEQRRLGVARELLADRPVVVLDEPTEGLDEETASRVLDALAHHYREGAVMVISHHDGDAARATRRLRLSRGALEELPLSPARPA